MVKNIQLHFNKNFFINKIDIEYFDNSFNLYKKLKMQLVNKEKKKRMQKKDPEMFNEKKKLYQESYKNKNPEEFRRKNLERVNQYKKKSME